MQTNWEFKNHDEMLSRLVGESFGQDPASRLAEIRRAKHKAADIIVRHLRLTPQMRVLEIGSGAGLLSSYVAPKVAQLLCCDISESFLKVAAQECQGLPNVSFHHIQTGVLDFLPDQSVDAVYSYNVFIHLNLFQIDQYLRELNRVLKPQGKIWFDISFGDSFQAGVPPLFFEMSTHFHKYPEALSGMLQWNSRSAVTALAAHYGFYLTRYQLHEACFTFSRKKPSALDRFIDSFRRRVHYRV